MNKLPHNPLEGDPPELSIKLHDNNEETISIIIIHKDKPDFLNMALQSIVANTFNTNYEIIIVDNNSGPETQAFLDDIQHKVKVVRNDKNLYWSAACNKGASVADKNSKYLIFCHHDIVVLNANWIDMMCSACRNNSSGLIGMGSQKYEWGDKKELEFVAEYCMMLTRECWDSIGPWPEKLPFIGHAFVLNQKARIKGYKPQYIREGYRIIHHYANASIGYDEYLKFASEAQLEISKILTDVQTKEV